MGNMLPMHTLPTAELTGALKARTVMFRSVARHDGSASKYELKPRSVGAFFCRQACGVVYSRCADRLALAVCHRCNGRSGAAAAEVERDDDRRVDPDRCNSDVRSCLRPISRARSSRVSISPASIFP